MPQRVNVILAAGVMLLGLAAASLFRRAPRADASPPPNMVAGSLSGQAVLGGAESARVADGGTGQGDGHAARPTAAPSYFAWPPAAPQPPLPRPPLLPSILDRLDQPAGGRHAPELVPLTVPPEPSSPAEAAQTAMSFRTHVIVDGDTLPSLAARYLGDSRRSIEIFDANRRVLTDPEILPLGVELKIPLRP